MNIRITSTLIAFNNSAAFGNCYNSIKRKEEDLRRRLPDLTNFNLIVRQSGTSLHYYPANLHKQRHISEDESTLTVTFQYKVVPGDGEILKAIEKELEELKKIYSWSAT